MRRVAGELAQHLESLPTRWEGKTAIIEMRDGGSHHWRQMEWPGFYFEFLCQRALSDIADIPGPSYGNVTFDAFKKFPWDFKAHAMNTSSHDVVVNDRAAIEEAIEEFGAVGVIIASGKVEYNDEDRTFQKWHERIKGGPSEYSRKRKQRGAWSRLRKQAFDLQQIAFVRIDEACLEKCGSFQRDFRNADGSPRAEKVTLNLEKLDEEIIHYIEFD